MHCSNRGLNEPAKGKYFVPGGVIRKNETMQDAFARILKAEVGIEASLATMWFWPAR
jgi:colanic acid biosynthesis protein WcaH